MITLVVFSSSLLSIAIISSEINMFDYIAQTEWSDSKHQFYVVLLLLLFISALGILMFRFYILGLKDKKVK